MPADPIAALNGKETYTLKQYIAHNSWLVPHAGTFKGKVMKLAQQGQIWRELDHTVEGRGGAPYIYWTKDLDAVANQLREHAKKQAEKEAAMKQAPKHYLEVAGLSPKTAEEMTAPKTATTPAPTPKMAIRYTTMMDEGKTAIIQIQKRGLYLVAHFQSEAAARDYCEWKNLTSN